MEALFFSKVERCHANEVKESLFCKVKTAKAGGVEAKSTWILGLLLHSWDCNSSKSLTLYLLQAAS